MKKEQPLSLKGIIQDYAWGGQDFLAEFTGQPKTDNTPWAELWLGAHPKGPAVTPQGPLDELLAEDPVKWLGEQAAKDWNGRLPFLLKVLDVRKMLSIQVHPNKVAAEIGFANEERSGPQRNAPNRNYRDDNHKPELGVAITDFYLLHGFKVAMDIEQTLIDIPGWSDLLPILKSSGVKGLYAHVMQAEQEQINEWLAPLAAKLASGDYERRDSEFWARQAFQQYTKDGNYDRGIFSIYWFNLVHLRPGEGIFQDAGIPHAYLEGVCVELMANSDNVLRGGLTPKHIDVPELIKQLDFKAITPKVLTPAAKNDEWNSYETPAPDFKLSTLSITPKERVDVADNQIAIYLVFQGSVDIGGLNFSQGQSFLAAAGQSQSICAAETGATLYRATVRE